MKISTSIIEDSIIYISILLVLLGLLVIGNISSFQFNSEDFSKQLIWVGISIVFFLLILLINLKKLSNLSLLLLILGFLILIAVFIPGLGVCINGSSRWIRIGPINFQPSTFARLILIFYLVHYLVKNKKFIEQSKPIQFVKYFMPIIIFTLLYIFLIYREPDLSTAAILFLIYLSILFAARIRISTIFSISFIAISLILLIVTVKSEPDYRSKRISAFMKLLSGKELDKEEENYCYHPRESLVALSNGKLYGRGSNQGKAKLFYLPFSKTDYIFAIFGEEYGFIGSTLLIIVYFILILGCLTLAQRANDFFYTLLIAGFTFNFAYNIIINIGVVISLIPSTGVSLPFISYGGSALLGDSIAIAIILNASRRARLNNNSSLKYA